MTKHVDLEHLIYIETYNKNPRILDNLRLGVSYIAYEQTSAIRR